MSDREVLDALSVLARRLGLLDADERLDAVSVHAPPPIRPEPAPATGCAAWEWGTNGHKAGCILRAGHDGPHCGVDADGASMFTWPCPCYPDCTGHTVTPAADRAMHGTSPSLSVRCPECDAPPGKECVVALGGVTRWPHSQRTALAVNPTAATEQG